MRYSWQRGTDPKILNPRAVIVLRNIADVEVVDRLNVRLKLKEPDASTLYNMEGAFYILSKKYMTEGDGRDEAIAKPIGTGPFKFVERKVGVYIKLTANDKHWGRVPKVGDVTMRVVPDFADALRDGADRRSRHRLIGSDLHRKPRDFDKGLPDHSRAWPCQPVHADQFPGQ